MKKLTFLLSALLISVMSLAAEVEMSSFSATSADMDSYISYTTNKGGGTSNPAINSDEIRLYQGQPGGNIIITAAEGATITEVTIGSSMETSIRWEIDEDVDGSNTSMSANGKVTKSGISTNKITCHCYGTDKYSRLYVNYLKVVYTIGGGSGDGGEQGGEGEGGETGDDTDDTEGGWVETAIGNITSSDIVVVTMTNSSGTYAMSNDKGTGAAPAAVQVTVDGDKLSADPADNLKWNISYSSGSLTIYPNGDSSKWLYCTGTNNGTRVGTNASKTFTIDGTYLKHTGTNRYVGVYNNQDWRCYTSTTTNIANQTLKFYKYVAPSSGGDPEPVIVKTLKSIAVTGMTTNFEIGETFTFDGTCTATYSVTKDGVAQADETVEVTPTDITEPDMSTAGTKEITVTYTEGEITTTVLYNITVENALPKIVITQNEVADFTNKYAEYTWTASGVSGKIYGYKNSGMQLNSSKDGSYVYNTDPIPGYIRKIKIVKAASGTARNWTPYVSETALTSAGGTTLDQKEVATTTTWEVDGKNSYFYLLESGGATVIESITIYYEAVVPQVAAPTFDPIEGTYNSVQNVTISAEEGATIHYTLDGQNPTTESPVYSTPIEIAETKTLKAIAVKDEKVSPIASATYTINLPLTTIDQIFAKATAVGSTAQEVNITFNNWVVSGVGTDNKTVYVTDGTKGFIIYTSGHGFAVGDQLSGTVACNLCLFRGSAEVVGLTSATTDLTVTAGGTVTTNVLDAAGIAALTGVNTGSVIKINGVCETANTIAGVKLYNTLFDFEDLELGQEYNVTGVYLQYNTTPEILPRSAVDIEEVVGLPTATISIDDITMEVGSEKTIEASITPDAAASTVTYAIKEGTCVTLDGNKLTAVAEGTATITATVAEAAGVYYGATKDFTVTVTPLNIATLPFAFDGKQADIANTLGMSHEGIDADDYASSPHLKFNTTGDYLIIQFDSEPDKLSYDIKGNGFSGGTFTVQESADGNTYTTIATYTELGETASEEKELASTSRYVKFIYTTKSSGNVALGNISITKPDTRAEASLSWSKDAVNLAVGDVFTAPTLNNPNALTGITFKSSDETIATVTTEGVATLVDGAIGTTTITALFAGDGTYKEAEVSYTIKVYDPNIIEVTFDAKEDEAENNESAGQGTITKSPITFTCSNGIIGKKDNEHYRMYKDSKNTFKAEENYVITKIVINCLENDPASGFGNDNVGYTYSDDKLTGTWTGKANTVELIVSSAQVRATTITVTYELLSTEIGEEDNSDVLAIAGPVNVTITREFTADNLYTIALPFALNNVAEIFGAGTVVYEYAQLAQEGADVVLYFKKVNALESGKPYLIEPTEDVPGFTVEGVTLSSEAKSISFTAGQTTISMNAILTTSGSESTNGEYWLTTDRYLNNGVTPILGLRALFEMTTISGMPPRARVSLGENGTTGIEDIMITNAPQKVIVNGQLIIIRDGVKYNVQGQKL